VIGGGDQDRVDNHPLTMVRQTPLVQQEDHARKRRLAHHLGDIVPVNPDVRVVVRRDRCPPRLRRLFRH